MIKVHDELACARFQRVAWEWLQSGEMTRTGYRLSPMEELCGYKYGFIYLLTIDASSVKIGFSEHPQRRIRELHAQYGQKIRLRACFVGELRPSVSHTGVFATCAFVTNFSFRIPL